MIGLMLLPATAMVTLLSSMTGSIVDTKGPKYLLVSGLGLCCITAFCQSWFNAETSIVIVLLSYWIFGVAWACILSPSIVAAVSTVSKDHSGVAMGTIGTLHNLGGTIGLALGTLIYETGAQIPAIKQGMLQMDTMFFLRGYQWAMWTIMIVSFVAFVSVLLGLKQQNKN